MHQLNDQWIEIIDGQERMVKAVEKCGKCTGYKHEVPINYCPKCGRKLKEVK